MELSEIQVALLDDGDPLISPYISPYLPISPARSRCSTTATLS